MGKRTARRATKEEGNLVTKGAHPNWVNARELGSLGKQFKGFFSQFSQG